jgi:hypothetical protein
VEQPTKFEFIINLKAAKQTGLTIPPVVMMRAEKGSSERGRETTEKNLGLPVPQRSLY